METDVAFYAPARSFRGEITSLGIHLTWETDHELPSAYVIKHSLDGPVFTRTGTARPSRDERQTFLGEGIGSQVVYYRLRQAYPDGLEQLSRTPKLGLGQGARQTLTAELLDSCPHPFSASATISYQVTEKQMASLSVWGVSRQPVQTLVEHILAPESWQAEFNGNDLPSSTYLVPLEGADGHTQARIILLTK